MKVAHFSYIVGARKPVQATASVQEWVLGVLHFVIVKEHVQTMMDIESVLKVVEYCCMYCM